MTIPRFHRPGFFFLSAFRSWTSVTIPLTQSVRPWYGHWHPDVKCLKKKNLVCETVVWSLTFRVENVLEKKMEKTRSERPLYDHRRTGSKIWLKKNDPVCQTVIWSLGVKCQWPALLADLFISSKSFLFAFTRR